MGLFINSLLQKSSNTDAEVPNKLSHRSNNVYHIPILNDMNDYQVWNEKLSKKINNLHKLYKRFIRKYEIKGLKGSEDSITPATEGIKIEDMMSRDQGITYSSDIAKHLLKHDNVSKARFVHYDMFAIESDTISIVNLFEDMEGKNPFSVKIMVENKQPTELDERIEEGDNNGDAIMKEGPEGNVKLDEEIEEVIEENKEDEYNLVFHEIPIKNRADIILYLCYLKADSVEFSKFVKKVRKEELKRNQEKKIKSEKQSEHENKSENIEQKEELLETDW